jgi:hypothetical protein
MRPNLICFTDELSGQHGLSSLSASFSLLPNGVTVPTPSISEGDVNHLS